MKLSYRSLRLLAKYTRLYRSLGCNVRSVSAAEGWLRTYDVEIAGRRFTLWSRESSRLSAAIVYVITIDGRVRFIERSTIFAPALGAWEALTGIRYLRRYMNGCPVYGCRHWVKLMPRPADEPSPFTHNYTIPIKRTKVLPALSYANDHDYVAVAA